jgi:hypothetical protein
MIPLLLVLLIVAVLVVGFRRRAVPPPLLDPEEATQISIELHAIRRRLDTAWTRSELRRDAARLRREIAKELNLDDKPGSG